MLFIEEHFRRSLDGNNAAERSENNVGHPRQRASEGRVLFYSFIVEK